MLTRKVTKEITNVPLDGNTVANFYRLSARRRIVVSRVRKASLLKLLALGVSLYSLHPPPAAVARSLGDMFARWHISTESKPAYQLQTKPKLSRFSRFGGEKSLDFSQCKRRSIRRQITKLNLLSFGGCSAVAFASLRAKTRVGEPTEYISARTGGRAASSLFLFATFSC